MADVSQIRRPQSVIARFPVTMGLLGLMAVFFALEFALGGVTDMIAHLRLGALRTDRVSEHGEYFRLLMPWFLHFGIIHLGFNGFALLQLGALVEYFWGSRRLLVYFVVCGVGSSLLSAIFNVGVPAVGASGAILGLAGVVLGTSWYGESPVREQLLELVGRQLLYGVLLTFGLGFGLSLLVPLVDNWGHVGGFVTGLLLAGATPDPTKENFRSSVAGASAAAVAIAGAIVWMAVDGGKAVETASIDMARTAAAQVSDGRAYYPAQSMVQMMVQFAEADAYGEGEETLERALAQVRDPAVVAGVVSGLEYARQNEGLALHPAIRIGATRLHELAPDDPQVLNTFAWELLHGEPETREPARAVELSRRSLTRLPDDQPKSRSAFLDTLAEALYQTGDHAAAREAQTEALALARAEELTWLERIGLQAPLPLDEMEARLARIEDALANR